MSAWTAGLPLLYRHRFLIKTLTRREIQAKYRGSFLGNFWPLAAPLMLLAVYTLVFGSVFGSRWPGASSDHWSDFAMRLFSGLLLYGLLSEVLGRAPELILQNPNYVTKVVFPLEALPCVSLGSGLFHFLIGVALLVVVNGLTGTGWHWAVLSLPLVMLPFALLLLGLSWMAAAVGVYLRDLGQLMPPLLSCLMVLSPVFFPRESAPAAMRELIGLNPLTFVIESMRQAVFAGLWPDPRAWLNYFLAALFLYLSGFWLFGKLKKGFADVI